jgi:sortase A
LRGITTSDGDHTGRATRIVAATLLLAGVTVAAYTVWALWWTALSADRAQEELRRRWTSAVGTEPLEAPSASAQVGAPLRDESTVDTAVVDRPATAQAGATAAGGTLEAPSQGGLQTAVTPGRPPDDGAAAQPPRGAPGTDDAPRAGDPYAVIWFSRTDRSRPPVHAEPLYVVHGVGGEELRTGPGHYPHSDAPGGPGNFAIAGHRTTYGAPFGRLDELRAGDRIHVVERAGRRWSYEVASKRIVGPDASWVLSADPLGTGTGTMTLTTCHPRWSATQRLIVFARLVTAGSG